MKRVLLSLALAVVGYAFMPDGPWWREIGCSSSFIIATQIFYSVLR